MKDDNIDFVTRHYREGAFESSSAWRRMGFGFAFGRVLKVAAASAGLVALTASAILLWRNDFSFDSSRQNEPVEQHQVVEPALAVKVIDFDNAPLPAVVRQIREVYGVEVSGLPEDADRYRLTLHFEGNAADLVESINELLHLELTLEQ